MCQVIRPLCEYHLHLQLSLPINIACDWLDETGIRPVDPPPIPYCEWDEMDLSTADPPPAYMQHDPAMSTSAYMDWDIATVAAAMIKAPGVILPVDLTISLQQRFDETNARLNSLSDCLLSTRSREQRKKLRVQWERLDTELREISDQLQQERAMEFVVVYKGGVGELVMRITFTQHVLR